MYDILISGGGAAGLSLAIALRRIFGDQLKLAVADPSLGRREPSVRTTALAAGSCNLLDAIGIWPRLKLNAQPILEMRISDSRKNDVVRPVYLQFDEPVGPGMPLAYMVRNRDLVDLLEADARDLRIELITQSVSRLSVRAEGVDVRFRDGQVRSAKLVVGADGAQSRIRAACGIETIGREYARSGIVATLRHEQEHGGVAVQHFLPAGSFAMLPLPGRRSSIVWTEPHDRAREYLRLPPDLFEAEVQKRFGWSLGNLTLEDAPAAFPLRAYVARRFVARRVALVGDAAHLINPLAGQGLNLGFRDVAALVSAVAAQIRLGLDPGSATVLESYEKLRFFDTASTIAATDGMQRLFANDIGFLRLIRDFGLGLVDRLPGLKRQFAIEAAGLGAGSPALLRGQLP